MSQQSVSTVEAWFGGFLDDAEAFQDTLHPEVVWFPFEDNHSPSRGIDGALRIRRHWLDSWSDQVVELEDLVDGDDNVVVTAHVTAHGRSSGIQVDTRIYFHFGLRDGKLVHIYEHLDRAGALEAAGLSE